MIPAEELAQHALFSGLDDRTLRAIGAVFSRRVVPAGTVLLEQGSRSGGAVLVLEGAVWALRTDEGGTVVVLDRCGPGALCGAEEVVEGIPREVSHVANGRTTIGRISSADFSALMDGRSNVALRFQLTVVRALFGVLRRGNARVAEGVLER